MDRATRVKNQSIEKQQTAVTAGAFVVVSDLARLQAIIDDSIAKAMAGFSPRPAPLEDLAGLCKYLKVSQPTARKMIDAGLIPYITAGEAKRFDLARVAEALSSATKAGDRQ